jgi:carbon starvation protein
MNILLPLLVALPIFAAAYHWYGRYMHRVMGADRVETPPSVAMNDGVDFVPSRTPIVFSHHFASIAGAGPIVGPTVAVAYGYMPVWLWIVFGAIFIGCVQDYTSLFVSMRERGQSMAQVASVTLGKSGFALVITFSIIMLLLLTSAFLGLSASALTSIVPIERLQITPEMGFLHIVNGPDGQPHAKIGGIASTSLILITLMAPLLGWLNLKRTLSMAIMLPAGTLICILSVVVGMAYPVSLSSTTWILSLSAYVILASALPVWTLLQPRDFINAFLLYFGMALLIAGTFAGGFEGVQLQIPAFHIEGGERSLGLIWPFLFITVACGAISGFHSMVTGGTTAKQVASEAAARPIAIGGMLTEAVLAILVVIAVGAGLTMSEFEAIVFPKATGASSNPVLAFALGMGNLTHGALGIPHAWGTVFGMLMVEGFIVTTLDTATRLTRYLLEELWNAVFRTPPVWLMRPIVNSTFIAGTMLLLCYTNTFRYIWPIIGSANQLMAAVSLIVVTLWLARRGRKYLFALIPAILMMLTTLFALQDLLFRKYIPSGNHPLTITVIILALLSAGLVVVILTKLRRRTKV